MRAWRALSAFCALCAALCAADNNVTVVHKTLPLEEEHQLLLDRSIEYILLFVPSAEQGQFPMRVWLRAEGGADVAHPLLVTARHRTGATTWQLPYAAGAGELRELQRTLCAADRDALAEPSDCESADSAESERRGAFSLHAAASCAAGTLLRLRAAPARDYLLPRAGAATLSATPAAPSVHRFSAWGADSSVRLVVSSPDDVCATVAVQPISCPIAQTAEQIEQSTVRMTVQRSGGVQLAKARFPLGFYVIALVHDSDEACSGQDAAAAAEAGPALWRAAVLGEQAAPRAAAAPRRKQLKYEIKDSLSWREYLTGTGVALAFFLAWYVAFGALVLAQRWPAWYNLVGPRAPEAEEVSPRPTEADAAPRCRDSTATFDSSDLSDTESEGSSPSRRAGAAPPAPAAGGTADGGSGTDFASAPPLPDDTAGESGTTEPDGAAGESGNAERVGTAGENGNGIASAPPPPAGPVGESESERHTAIEIPERGERTLAVGEQGRAFGLPAAAGLHAGRLARRRGRVLRARSQRYLYALYTVAVFYTLPVLQFVAAFQVLLNVSGSLDLCYYNWLCAHPLGALSDFNHVYSNLGYLLLGALYMWQLRRRRRRAAAARRPASHGLAPHHGLAASLGAGMMVVALLSACYHVCPNSLNFQFDTAFMYVLAVLSCVKIYQARHPDINARAHATFGVLAVLIALVVWGVLGGGALFWSVFTVLHVFTFLLLSLRIYYLGQFRLGKASVSAAARALWAPPLYRARLAALLAANGVHWAFALYGLLVQPDVAGHLLFVLLANALLHMVYYVGMKLAHGERLRWYAWLYVAGAAAAWAPALWLFRSGSTDWSATPAHSRHLNHECRLLSFYDAHDLWHMLSAVALYLTFNAMLCWDDGLAAFPRTHIPVF